IRRLAANSGHGSTRKDPGRSGTWADWFTGRAGRELFWNESDCLEPEHDARGRQSHGRNPGFQGPAVRAGRHSDDPFGVEQPYARPGRGRGAGENEANGLVDQCVTRADRRRASLDQRAEEQANRRRGDRRIRLGAAAPVSPLPDAGQRTGNTAYRLRIARSLQDVLRGYRLEYSEVARRPSELGRNRGKQCLKGSKVRSLSSLAGQKGLDWPRQSFLSKRVPMSSSRAAARKNSTRP